jgi:hypothetical protein
VVLVVLMEMTEVMLPLLAEVTKHLLVVVAAAQVQSARMVLPVQLVALVVLELLVRLRDRLLLVVAVVVVEHQRAVAVLVALAVEVRVEPPIAPVLSERRTQEAAEVVLPQVTQQIPVATVAPASLLSDTSSNE